MVVDLHTPKLTLEWLHALELSSRFLHFLGEGKQQEGYLAKNILLEHFFFSLSISQHHWTSTCLQQCPGHHKVVPEMSKSVAPCSRLKDYLGGLDGVPVKVQ